MKTKKHFVVALGFVLLSGAAIFLTLYRTTEKRPTGIAQKLAHDALVAKGFRIYGEPTTTQEIVTKSYMDNPTGGVLAGVCRMGGYTYDFPAGANLTFVRFSSNARTRENHPVSLDAVVVLDQHQEQCIYFALSPKEKNQTYVPGLWALSQVNH